MAASTAGLRREARDEAANRGARVEPGQSVGEVAAEIKSFAVVEEQSADRQSALSFDSVPKAAGMSGLLAGTQAGEIAPQEPITLSGGPPICRTRSPSAKCSWNRRAVEPSGGRVRLLRRYRGSRSL